MKHQLKEKKLTTAHCCGLSSSSTSDANCKKIQKVVKNWDRRILAEKMKTYEFLVRKIVREVLKKGMPRARCEYLRIFKRGGDTKNTLINRKDLKKN